MNSQGTRKRLRALLTSLIAALVLSAAAAAVAAQANKPITRRGLVQSVRINGLPTRELVNIIQRRGVDFEMTADAEGELRGAGARPEIIEAARSSYRPATAPARASSPAPSTTHPASNSAPANRGTPVPAGPPLSKNEIVTMLQGGIAPARVEQFVEARGVNFAMTPEVAREINAAGGNRALVGAITEKATVETADRDDDDNGSHTGPANSAPDYDELMDRAQSAITASDLRGAVNFAQEAVRLDPSQPMAYSLLGTLTLYVARDVPSAEQLMRAAIERGGAAAFRAFHDHANGTFSAYCEGSFFVTKSGVSFKANDGQDTFETEDSNIKEAKMNAFVGAEYGAFHIKPVQKINGRDNFNFAPLSQNVPLAQKKAEAQLMLRLIKEYQ